MHNTHCCLLCTQAASLPIVALLHRAPPSSSLTSLPLPLLLSLPLKWLLAFGRRVFCCISFIARANILHLHIPSLFGKISLSECLADFFPSDFIFISRSCSNSSSSRNRGSKGEANVGWLKPTATATATALRFGRRFLKLRLNCLLNPIIYTINQLDRYRSL